MGLMSKRASQGKRDDSPARGDRELLSACLQGDARAWEALIARYQRLIYSIPIKMRLSPNDAADVFQSVCLKLLENLPTLRNQDKLSSWLTITTRRESWRLARRRRREHVIAADESGDGPDELSQMPDRQVPLDEQQAALEQQQILRQAVEQLPERCRQLITLLFYRGGDLSYDEIARQLGIPRASMGPTRARCLARLKKLLEGKL
jgi:RNA polymerase sigma factor (sigma-70 family)